MVARLVKSLAGHDKESLYFVMREDASHVYLVDGVLKLVENPKKKNKKHVQPIVKMKSDELEKKLMVQVVDLDWLFLEVTNIFIVKQLMI